MLVVLIWAMAGLVVALYILFVVWRLRVERRKKAMQQESTSTLSSTIARAAASALPSESPAARIDVPAAPAPAFSASPATVAEALSGISLPSDLAPLVSMAERGGVGDRVAFWTTVPGEVVGPAFGVELERLGYTVSSLDEHTLAAQRDGARLITIVHPDAHKATIGGQPAFPTVPELSTVIEVWIPV